MKNVLAFVNPRSRQGARVMDSVQSWLEQNGFAVLNASLDPEQEDASALIRAHAGECRAVIVGGGDGSVNHLLPALLESGLPLLLVPLGTANNLARTLEIPLGAKEALSLLETGVVKKIDVGVANGIPFINVIGLGLSTQVNRLTRGAHKRWLGVTAFIWTALKVALRMTPFQVWITTDGQRHTAKTWQITVCNGRNYGCGLVINEQATLSDGTLHGLSTEVKKWWHVFKLIPSLMMGRFQAAQDVTLLEGQTMRVETRRPMRVDVDGDIKTITPLEVRVRPKALKIYVPESTAP